MSLAHAEKLEDAVVLMLRRFTWRNGNGTVECKLCHGLARVPSPIQHRVECKLKEVSEIINLE